MDTLDTLSPFNGALSALQSVKPNKVNTIKSLDALYLVPVEMIDTEEQPRFATSFGDHADEELANQIAEERAFKGGVAGTGILQALMLRPNESGLRYVVVAGERRFRAALRVGIPEVPAFIESMSPSAAWRTAIVENVQRKDLTGIEEGHAYQTWMENEGIGPEEIAKAVGKSVSHVRERLNMLKAPADLRAMVSANPRTQRAVRELQAVPEIDRRVIVQQLTGGATYNSLKPQIEKVRQKHLARTRQTEMEKATSLPNTSTRTIRLPRIPYADIISRFDHDIESAINVCADVPPQGDKKRELEQAIERWRERLDHLESII